MTAKTLKPAAKKNVKVAPLLEAAQAANPHKGANGWSKEAAAALLGELNERLSKAVPTSDQALTWLAQYGPLAGWKEVAKTIVKASAR